MERTIRAGSVLLAALLGLLFAFLFGSSPGFVSLQVWLGATFSWLVLLAVLMVTRRFPVQTGRRRPLIDVGLRQKEVGPPLRPASLQTLDRQFALAVGDGKAFDRHLRPQLVRLAATHGCATEDLGPAAWILDPDITDRDPTTAELNAIARAFPPAPSITQEHRL